MKNVLALAVICCFAVTAGTLAEDLNPPPWRGQWSTTVQYWEFMTGDPGPLPPDGPGPLVDDPVGPPYEQPGYLPSTELTVVPGPGMEWIQVDEISGRVGIWPLSGVIDVIVDNHDPKPENEKWIWIQLTWRAQDIGEYPIIHLDDPSGNIYGPVDPFLEEDLGLGWTLSKYFYVLDWNPEWESVHIEGTIDVDELVIDTWCIPEPGTMVLLAAGLPLLLRRKW